MKVHTLASAGLGFIALVAMASPGCGGGDDAAAAGDTRNTSDSTSSSSGSSSSSSTGGGTGGGGGGSAGIDYGPPSSETVSAGEVTKSDQYKMVFTLGQPTQNQGKSTSPAYRMQGGVIGANGSLP